MIGDTVDYEIVYKKINKSSRGSCTLRLNKKEKKKEENKCSLGESKVCGKVKR